MTSASYLSGRQKYARPQGMLWAESPGTLENGRYVPQGYEVNADVPVDADQSLIDNFIILSDDNRGSIDFAFERIERRERTVNGRMRSYHIADKLTISTSWEMLPSRSFITNPLYNAQGKPSTLMDSIDHDDDPNTPDRKVQPSGSPYSRDQQYTSDGGAGGVEILDWYESHQGPFWVFLAYDNYSNFGKDPEDFLKLGQYNQIVEMYISDFNYSVARRGAANYDFWNISVTLEEV